MTSFKISSGKMEIEGFSQCVVAKSIESIAGYFFFSFKDKRSLGGRPIDIPFGDEEIEIFVGNRKRIKGYLEFVRPTKQADGRLLTLGGREVTCDLADCTIEKVKSLTGPLSVVLKQITSSYPNIKYQQLSSVAQSNVTTRTSPGESYWKAMERLSRKAGAILWTNGDGVVNIGSAKPEKLDLVLDERVIAAGAEADYSAADLFSKYLIRGDGESEEGSELWGIGVKSSYTHVSDFIKRQRTLCITGESQQTAADSKKRAIWESNIRLARGIKTRLPLRGLSDEAIDLIDINKLVRVKDEAMGLDRDLLITSYTIAADSTNGTTVTIECTLPGAYQPEPLSASEIKKEIGNSLQIRWD